MDDKEKPASAGFFYGHVAILSGVNTDFALERVHSLRSRTPKKAKITICRLVLNLRSQFFQSRLFFSNQAATFFRKKSYRPLFIKRFSKSGCEKL